MKKIFIIITFFLFLSDISYSIDTVSTKYFPLQMGNSWTYLYYSYGVPSFTLKKTVASNFITNGHLYYILFVLNNNSTSYAETLRVDSTNGNLLKPGEGCSWRPNDILKDSLASGELDACLFGCIPNNFIICTSDSLYYNNYGLHNLMKEFNNTNGTLIHITHYVKNIGKVYDYTSLNMNPQYYEMKGCKINGVIFGDTALIGISSISTEIPSSYKLYQNYPNPFNPTTKIKFDVPSEVRSQRLEVRLIVNDILGREVSALVNEELTPGTYEVEWDAANYSSGIYFYTLSANNFTQTKRMLLIK
ncbi:MAG: T9SS C-terminal target domain-containing protein [Ignavibacteriae bacterium]|nr:MAG: T9SS C-terminal target domain-containing protein [Ignavibacteriota bacterium]